MNSYFKKSILSLLAVVIVSLQFSFSNAATCSVSEEQYISVQTLFDGVDIRKTTVNTGLALITELSSTLGFGLSPDKLLACSIYFARTAESQGATVNEKFRQLYECEDLNADAQLSETQQLCDQVSGKVDYGKLSYNRDGQQKAVGSLASMYRIAEHAGSREPVPVNLAFWYNKKIEAIPVVNSAFAADVQYGDNPFLLDAILKAWEAIRNMAYAVLAIIMLFVGIMLIMRRKINPQAVITIQAALPQIIIAVILIAFSYPIGAVLATLAWNLAGVGFDVASSIDYGAAGQSFTAASTLQVLTMAFGGFSGTAAQAGFGNGGILFAGFILFGVVLIVQALIIWIKIVLTYIRMVGAILFSPLVFTMGALPNNQSTINWFKTMLAHLITIPAMTFTFRLAAGIVWSIANQPGPFSLLMAIAGPIVLIYAWGMVIGMPKQVEGWIIGEQKGKR